MTRAITNSNAVTYLSSLHRWRSWDEGGWLNKLTSFSGGPGPFIYLKTTFSGIFKYLTCNNEQISDAFRQNLSRNMSKNAFFMKNSNLYYSLNTLSGVASERRAHLRGFAPMAQTGTHQGCSDLSDGKSLATCGRFDRLGIWTPYLPLQRQTTCAVWPIWIMYTLN